MQRLFISFPGGFHGAGLLLLRLATCFTLFCLGCAFLPRLEVPAYALLLISGFGSLAIAFLLIGFLTPVASVTLMLEVLGVLGSLPAMRPSSLEGRLLTIDLFVLLIGLATSGPGAFSLDARAFGRREIIFPG